MKAADGESGCGTIEQVIEVRVVRHGQCPDERTPRFQKSQSPGRGSNPGWSVPFPPGKSLEIDPLLMVKRKLEVYV